MKLSSTLSRVLGIVSLSMVFSLSLNISGGFSQNGKCLAKNKATSTEEKAQSDKTAEKRVSSGTEVVLVKEMPPTLYWPAKSDKPKAVVLCLHELGMHAGVFEDMAERLSKEDMAVYSMDLRGFGGWRDLKESKNLKGGKSLEKNADMKDGRMNIVKSLKDVKEHLAALKEKYPDLKVFLLGEAMGGAIALEAQSLFPELCAGTISSCPGGGHYKTWRNYSKVGGHFLANPNKDFGMAKSLIQEATPRKEQQEFLANDPQVRMDLTPKELMSCQFYMYKARRFARGIKEQPVMIVQGMKDGESRPDGAQQVYKSLSTKDKKFMEVAQGDHYIFEDKSVNDKVFNDTVSWLGDHLKPSM